VVEAAFRRWGGPKRFWSCGREYGHADVILGRNAPEVVYPMIRDFLLENSEEKPTTTTTTSTSTTTTTWSG
jgi:hypothetical protein